MECFAADACKGGKSKRRLGSLWLLFFNVHFSMSRSRQGGLVLVDTLLFNPRSTSFDAKRALVCATHRPLRN